MTAVGAAVEPARSIDLRGADAPRALVATRDSCRRLAAGEVLEIVVDSGRAVDLAIASYFEKRRQFYELERLGSECVRIRVTQPR